MRSTKPLPSIRVRAGMVIAMRSAAMVAWTPDWRKPAQATTPTVK